MINYNISANLKFLLMIAAIVLAYIKYGDGLFRRIWRAIKKHKQIKKTKKVYNMLAPIINKYRQLESSGDAEIPNMSGDEYMKIYEGFLKIMTVENSQYVHWRIFDKFVTLRNEINPYISTKKYIERDYAAQSKNETNLQSQINDLHEDCYENTHTLMEKFVQEIEWSFNKP